MHDLIPEAVEDATFCLEKLSNADGDGYQLRREHSYYYQVSYAIIKQLHEIMNQF